VISDSRPKIQGVDPPLSSPLYLLYSQAADLTLKAFLRAKGEDISIPKNHSLVKLLSESCRLGLVIEERFQIDNLMSLLDSGNRGQNFRYVNLGSFSRPDLSWVREGIPELIRAVEPHVQDMPASTGAQMTLTFSKPTPKPGLRLWFGQPSSDT
jgi:hypothetical protein